MAPFPPYKYLLPSTPLPHQSTRSLELASSSEEARRTILTQSSRAQLQLQAFTSQRRSRMSRGVLDLKLQLSPPVPARRGGGERAASASSDEEWSSSSPSSCLSSEGEREPHHGLLQWSDSPEATSMVLAACPRCLMYVMLSEADPRCPRCRSPVLLDFLHHAAGAGNSNRVDVNGAAREENSRNRTTRDGGGGGGRRNRRA